MSVVATFVEKGEPLLVDGIACTVTAVYVDGSAFVVRDEQGRVSTIRNSGALGRFTLGGRSVELAKKPRRTFDELMSDAWAALGRRGLRRPVQE